MSARRIKGSWWIDVRFDGLRYRKRCPDNSRAGALAYEALLRQRFARGEDIFRRRDTGETFASFAERWFSEYVITNNKPSEQLTKRYVLDGWLIPFFGRMRIDAITVTHLDQFKGRQARSALSNKTINNQLTILHRCLATAYEWFDLQARPPRTKLLRCPPPQTDYLTEEEGQQLLTHAEGTLREMIFLGLRTGMRQGEIKGLQWSSINWETRTLSVRHSRIDREKALGSPKSNRERYIPLDPELYELLARRKRSDGYVFTQHGRPITQSIMATGLTRACQSAGVRRITWHILRHSFASHLAMKGAPVPTIQSLLGHSTITMTMRYAHVSPSALRSAIELLATPSPSGHHMGTSEMSEAA